MRSAGTRTLGDTTRVDRLDPHTDRWRHVAPIPTARRYLDAVTANGRIYAIGGYDARSGALAGVGVYLPGHNRWIQAAKLLVPTAGAAATVGHDNRIYVFGAGTKHTASFNAPRSTTPAPTTGRSAPT